MKLCRVDPLLSDDPFNLQITTSFRNFIRKGCCTTLHDMVLETLSISVAKEDGSDLEFTLVLLRCCCIFRELSSPAYIDFLDLSVCLLFVITFSNLIILQMQG